MLVKISLEKVDDIFGSGWRGHRGKDMIPGLVERRPNEMDRGPGGIDAAGGDGDGDEIVIVGIGQPADFPT